jgi:hypothetical protein
MSSESTMIITGHIVDGVGAASKLGGLPTQLPLFEQQYDELLGAYPATINVDIHQVLDFKIDFSTWQFSMFGQVHWCEFIRVLFEYPLGATSKGWIYQPYGYHRTVLQRKTIIEILVSKKLDNVVIGDGCLIHLLNGNEGSSSTIYSARWV